MYKVKGSAGLVIAAAVMIMFLTGCETTKHAEVMSAEELAAQAQASGSQGSATGSVGEQGGIPLAGQGLDEGSLSVGDVSGTEAPAPSGISELALSPEGPPLPTLRDVSGEGAGGDISGVSTIADIREDDIGISDEMAGETDSRVQLSRSDLSDLMTEYPTGNRGPSAFFGPETPPQTYLREGADRAPVGEPKGPREAGMTEMSVGAGPHGYEGQQFVRALTPSDFVPEGPPLPTMGNGGVSTDSGMVTSGTSDSGTVTNGTSPSGEEVVRLPDDGGASDSMEPLSQGDLGGSQEDGSSGIGGGGGLGHVYFDFDQFVIRDDAVSTLQENAQLLSATYQDSSVLIEGHCDERGTTDYNLVLGERRAQAVKDYLVDLGVSSSRIQIVSYGKERPSCTGSEESCYQENRRGHVVLQ